MNKLADLLKAASFSAKKHTGQKRKGANGEPYINHPIEVAMCLADAGEIEEYDILIAAILHDTLEDTETTEEEITQLFGAEVCEIVKEVTDDKTLSKEERKRLQVDHAPRLSQSAKQIKLADKISNIEDVIENPPENWSIERRLKYVEWGERVIEGVRGINPKLENLFDEVVHRAKINLAN